MFSKSRSLLLAAAFTAVPLVTLMAQQNNPTGNAGANSSSTATPGTMNNNPSATTTSHCSTGN